MKIYVGEKGYVVNWKSKIPKNHWYNMEPVKMKIHMGLSDYYKMLENFGYKSTSPKNMRFNIHKFESENLNWKLSSLHKNELWEITAKVDSSSISSKFRDGTIIAIFDIYIKEAVLQDKSVLRNILLSELV